VLTVAAAAALAAGAAVAALAWAPAAGSLDDLFVVLSDARGWLAGVDGRWREDGIGRPTVEGTTSALDLIVKAVALAAHGPGSDPLLVAGAVTLPMLMGAAVASALGGAALAGPGRRATGAALAGLGVATGLGLAESAAFRLEGASHALVWVGALWAAGSRRFGWAVALSLPLALARPEGQLLAPFVVALAGRGGRGLRGFAIGAAVSGAVLALRAAIHGAPWPNTFYAKSSDSRVSEVVDGAVYLGRALAEPAGAALVVLAIGLSVGGPPLGRARPEGRPAEGPGEDPPAAAAWSLAALAGLAALVLVLSGGDSYAGARLALPLAPALWLAVAAALGSARRPAPLGLAAGLALTLQVAGALPSDRASAPRALAAALEGIGSGSVDVGILRGEPRALEAMASALDGETVAHRHAQRIRWFVPGVEVLDMTGLTDADVARRPHGGQNRFGRDALDLALERRVGAIHLAVGWAAPRPLSGVPLREALTDPALHPEFVGAWAVAPDLADAIVRDYRAASFPHGRGARPAWFNLLVRADLAGRFERAGFSLGPAPASPGRPR